MARVRAGQGVAGRSPASGGGGGGAGGEGGTGIAELEQRLAGLRKPEGKILSFNDDDDD